MMLKRPFKSRGVSESERRQIALENQQKEDRKKLIEELRGLVVSDFPKGIRRWDEEKQFAKQLMFADWLVDKPNDLYSNWLVQLRPEGKRCILINSHGRVTIRNKQGRVLNKLCITDPSLLPLGLTILDCVIPDTIQGFACCIYVLDVIYWDEGAVAESEAEFRHFWLASRFSEISPSESGNTIDFEKMQLLPRLVYVRPQDASPEIITGLYSVCLFL